VLSSYLTIATVSAPLFWTGSSPRAADPLRQVAPFHIPERYTATSRPRKRQFQCEIRGNVVVVKEVGGELVCCDQPMVKEG